MESKFPDTLYLRQLARDQLVLCLECFSGQKDLVLDPELMRPLDRIAGASLLKEHGVDKIFKLEAIKSIQGCGRRIYLIRPKVKLVKYIADQINSDVNAGIKRQYKILFVPRKLHVCELILEQEGVHGYVQIDEYQLDFIPLDADLLSLELPDFFTSFYLDGDQTWCHTAARGLATLQQVFGLVPNVYGQGRCAKMVHDITDIIFEEEGEPKQLNSEIGHMFLLDRDVDYVTALCSQVCYEGLLDDIFGISSGFVEFGSEVTGRDQPMKLLLTGADSVYEEIRGRHFSNVFGFLSAKAKELQAGYDKRHQIKSVGQMKSFVANDLRDLKQQHKSLSLHISACEVIIGKKTRGGDFEEQLRTEHSLLECTDTKENISYIEEIINRQYNKYLVLRLLCLLSQVNNGLPSQTFRYLKTQFTQSYGFEHMITFHNLQKLGLISEQDPPQVPTKQLSKVAASIQLPRSSQYKGISRKLNLIPKSAEEINLKIPNDMSYVFSGAYTPMLCKLIDQVLQKEGFTGLDDVVKLLPGPNFSKIKAKSARGGTQPQPGKTSKVVLVYFLGGCTYSEVNALRFLGKQRGYQFLIATTGLINGNSLLDKVIEKKPS